MISILESEVSIIRQKIDQLDLQCNGVIDIKIQVLDSNDVVYTFNPTQFQSFFNGFYGINAYSNFVSAYKENNQNLSLYATIFSQINGLNCMDVLMKVMWNWHTAQDWSPIIHSTVTSNAQIIKVW